MFNFNYYLEIRKGILFIRLIGNLNKNISNYFYNQVFKLIISNDIKYIVFNFKYLTKIDKKSKFTIQLLEEQIKGEIYYCNISGNLKLPSSFIKKSTTNEITAMHLLEI